MKRKLLEMIKTTRRDSIKLKPLSMKNDDDTETIRESLSTLGSSRLLGTPDLPKDFKWPYAYNEFSDKIEPLNFIAQIDLEKASKYDKTGLLPKTGFLCFFSLICYAHWEASNKDCVKVYYLDCKRNELVNTNPPSDFDDFYLDSKCTHYIDFESADSYNSEMDFDDIADEFDISDLDVYDAIPEVMDELGDGFVVSKMFGYANCLQYPDEEDCEQIYRELYGDDVEDSEWLLLLQCAYQPNRKHVCFYIRKNDLESGRFDRVWGTTQLS